jgi:hypothetical protein
MKNLTDKIIESFKNNSNNLVFDWQKKLDEEGYLILENTDYMKNNLISLRNEAIKLIEREGDKGGWEGKEKYFKPGKRFESGAQRLGGLVNKHEVFLKLISVPEILICAYHVIKNQIKICGMNLRNPIKNLGEQTLHFDGFPRNSFSEPYTGIVAFIYLDDSIIDNGAMRVVPGTHKLNGWPDDHININEKHPKEIRLEVKAGTIVIANLNLWHAGGKNISGDPRKVIMLNIKNREHDQLLNYKKYLGQNFIKNLDQNEKYLLAVREEDPDQIVESGGSSNQLRREYFKNKNKKFTSVANN